MSLFFDKFENLPSASRAETPEIEKVICVSAICALASLPMVLSVVLTIWGS